MTPGTKRMLIGSIAASAIVGILSIVDLVAGVPFAGQTVLDIMFLASAGLIGYMGWDTYREIS
jgi:hypothetical protein